MTAVGSRTARRAGLGCALVAALLAAACTGSDGSGTSPSATPGSPTSSATTSPSSSASRKPPAKPAARPVNPLTGRGAVPKLPLVAVKIDDTAPGRPQRGIDRADIVYIEEAEAGLSRLLAVFGTYKPVVGYVRSTRPSDPDLLLEYGKITLAASGGGHDALPLLDRSGIKGWINDRGAAYYSRVYRPQSTYINLVLDLKKVATHIRTPRPHSIGLTWNRSVTGLKNTPRAYVVRTRVGSQVVEFRYNPNTKMYVRYINGYRQVAADGQPVATPNVIVQACTIVPHPQDTDVNGNPSQFTETVGSGRVSVFRNGRRINGKWERTRKLSGTKLTSKGKPIDLTPGGAWVALVRRSVTTYSS